MLTVEEAKWTLKVFKVYSFLNLVPLGVDVKSGRIERQSSGLKVFLWKVFFGIGVAQSIYVFARLLQSTILEPEKYFRWDHFVLHFGTTSATATFYLTGFRLFIKNPKENVLVFNQLFTERGDLVQKMVDQSNQREKPNSKKLLESGNGTEKQGNKTRIKIEVVLESTSAAEPQEEIEMEVVENQSESKSIFQARPLLTWPLQYSLDELVAKIVPLICVVSGLFVILILAVDPSRPQLLYSVLPPEYKNISSFSILLAVEALWTQIYFSAAAFAVVNQVLFFGKCQLGFQRMSLQLRNFQEKFQNCSISIENENGNGGQKMEREIWILRQILEEMRELVLLIELFNRCFPFCIFAWKICSISAGILFYFFLIRHVHDFPVLAVFLGYAATAAIVVYFVMYAHAFSIPGKIDELKQEFLLTAQKQTSQFGTQRAQENKIFNSEMKREVKRIHCVGIKVGSFHQMERESTPNLVDFIFRNVVSLLVTFPR